MSHTIGCVSRECERKVPDQTGLWIFRFSVVSTWNSAYIGPFLLCPSALAESRWLIHFVYFNLCRLQTWIGRALGLDLAMSPSNSGGLHSSASNKHLPDNLRTSFMGTDLDADQGLKMPQNA